MSPQRVFSEAWSDWRASWPRLLGAFVVYQAVAFVLLIPLVGLALRGFLHLSGREVAADQDILFFILSPFGIAALLSVAAGGLAILAAQQAALMTLGFDARGAAPARVEDALAVAARHLRPLLAITGRIVLRGILLAAPFLAAGGLVYTSLLTAHDINFYLSARPREFWIAAALIGAILLALLGVVVPRLFAFLYALPLHLFEGMASKQALAESTRRMKGRSSTPVRVLLVWVAFSLLVTTLTTGLVALLGRSLVPRAQGSLNLLLFVMGAVLLVWGVGSLFSALLQSASFALLVLHLYRADAGTKPTQAIAPASKRGGFPRKPALLALVAAAVVAATLGHLLIRGVRTEDEVLVIAHRGAAGRAPENTLASFRAAMDDGADLVELDVQETKAGEVVVLHDNDFMRIAREGIKVWDGELEELRRLDIGSWFSPEFASERLPTLEEVLLLAKSRGARLNIELKYYGHNQRLEERVVELVERTGMTPNVVIMSLEPDMVRKVRELRPRWTVGLLTATAVGNLARTDADFLAVHTGMANRRFVRRAQATGKKVYVWTVNDPLLMSRMMSQGVDGVITDEPALAKDVIARRRGLSSVERLLLVASYWLGAELRELPPETDAH
ncbi:MAG TPA: glycerophosphodiester phosphodiesterase [Vicinamibacteria bacterium]|nr:glycerophosphodiester phosphodiesterase [Vicinamibacteria bacterium]